MTSADELSQLERRMAELMAESTRLHAELARLRRELQGVNSRLNRKDGESAPQVDEGCGEGTEPKAGGSDGGR